MSTVSTDLKPDSRQNSVGESGSLFWLNVFLLGAEGIAISLWLLYYTSIFPEVAGLLSLGGALAWIGFVCKILSDNRTNELRRWTEIRILGSAGTLVCLSALGLLMAVVGNFRGGVQLEAFQESSESTVHISVIGKQPSDPLHLPPVGQLRWTVWTTWWSPTRVTIKVSGYPNSVVQIRPWQRVAVYVPTSLLRPIVLLRPTVPLIDVVRDTSMTLELVITEAHQLVLKAKVPFDGHAIWIGGDDDIWVPAEIERAWRDKLTASNRISHISFWLPPVAPPEFSLPLRAGQQVKLVLRDSRNEIYATKSFNVTRLRGNREFVQEVELDVPTPTP